MRWIAKVVLCLGLVGCAADGIDDADDTNDADEVELASLDDIEIENHLDALTLPNVFRASQVVKGATLTCERVTTSFPTRCIGPRVNGRPIVSKNRWDAAVAICRAVINAEGRTANTIGDSRLAQVVRLVAGRWLDTPPDGRIVTDISCHAGQRRSLRGIIRIFNADLTCDEVVETFPIRCIGPRINGVPLIARSRWDLAEVVCQLIVGVKARTSNTIGDARTLITYDLDRPRQHFFRTAPSGRIVTDFSCFAPPFPD